MKKKLTANLGLKALALLTAVALWFIVLNINDPVDRAVFRGIQVEVLNSDIVSAQGKIYEVLDNTDTVDVTVWAKRSILDSIRKDNIIATADMEDVNLNDTMVRIKLSSNRYNDRIENMVSSVESMSIKIEDLVRKQLYINAETTGSPAGGYMLGKIKTEQNLIRLSGPKSFVDQAFKATAGVDVSGLSKDIRTTARVNLYDADGNILEESHLRKSIDSVAVDIEILKTASVPIEVKVGGTPAEGYSMTGLVETNPGTIDIAGSEALINEISSIVIPETEVSVTGEMSNYTTSVDITRFLPAGITLVDPNDNQVGVTVNIERLTTQDITIEKGAISIENIPEGKSAGISGNFDHIRIRVRGLATNLSVMPDALIPATVNIAEYMRQNNLQELPAGEYEMPVTLMLPEGIRQDSIETVPVRIDNSP